MAKNLSLATYKAKGSAGLLTFSNWLGISYFKQKATSVGNPKTSGQVNQRARLSKMVEVFRGIATIILIGFREKKVKMSAYNAFVKANIMSALTYVSEGVYTLDWVSLKVSAGTLGDTPVLTSSASGAGNNLTLTYSNTVDTYGQALTDLAMVFYYNNDTQVGGWSTNSGKTRADGTITVTVEGGVTTGDEIYAYLFFASTTDNKCSNSIQVTITAGA